MGIIKKIQLLAVCSALLFTSANANAQLIFWQLLGDPGNQTSEPGDSADPTGVLALDITRGSGLTSTEASNSISSAGWDSAGATDYFSFGFTVLDGYELDLTNLLIGTRASNTGPGNLGLFYSGDGFATSLYTFTQSGSNFLNSDVDLSGLTGLTGQVEFRILALDTTSANGGTIGPTGTYRITEYFESGTSVGYVGFNGTVNLIPEPSSALLLAMASVGVLAIRRRR